MIMTSEKRSKRIYWAVTAPFVVTLMLAGVMLLAGVASNVEGIMHLGYPIYICKILGCRQGARRHFDPVRTVSDPKRMGNLLGASASHVLYRDPFIKIIVPIIILAFVLVSYRLSRNSLVQAVQGA